MPKGKRCGVTPDELEGFKGDSVFQRRLAYLKDHRGQKRRKPKTYDDYERYALRKLHSLAEKAGDDRVQVSAAVALGKLANDLRRRGRQNTRS